MAGSSNVPTSNGEVRSQYHHFIPRFILKNFAHPFRPPKSTNRGGRRKKHQNGCYSGDLVLNVLDISKSTPEFVELPVAKTFGMTDMYRDFAHAPNQHELEQQLSLLESRAGIIITKIRKSFEGKNENVCLSRSERNELRRFLFIMKYRGSGFHTRYFHQTANGYSSDDQHRLQDYMRTKGYTKPLDVWYDNIRAILNLKMDSEGGYSEWMKQLTEKMYPDDAQWALCHIQMSWIALCTPADASDEFLLTANLSNIHEGPVSQTIDPQTGKENITAWTEYHGFSMITPRLAVVLRSFMLPEATEDANPDIKAQREEFLRLNTVQHLLPNQCESMLKDLPVHKARNNYSEVINGRLRLIKGEDGKPRAHHKFTFPFFAIPTKHVNIINHIILENASVIPIIAFKSKVSIKRALESYLATTLDNGEARAFKSVRNTCDDPRWICIQKLESAARQLGSDQSAVYQVIPRNSINDDRARVETAALEEMFTTFMELRSSKLSEEPTDFMKTYAELGGEPKTLATDLTQSSRMLNLRIKIDVWSKGVDEDQREINRENLRQLFCELPPRRVWLYAKRIRQMLLGSQQAFEVSGSNLDGAEDAIAHARSLFRPKDLCRVMYFAAMTDTRTRQHPDFDIRAPITMDEAGYRQLDLTRLIVFGEQGIPVLEKLAEDFLRSIHAAGIPAEERNPFWFEDDHFEMAMRCVVRHEILKDLKGKAPPAALIGLKHALFEVLYPTLFAKEYLDSQSSGTRA